MRITPVEAGHRIQLPAEWAAELGLEKIAALEKTPEGILIHPCPDTTWDEIFGDKLPMSQQPAASDDFEVSRDDLLL